MARAWAVHERVPKFNKRFTMSDINKVARKAAKKHREKFGCNPIKKVPDDSVNANDLITFPVYHYKDEGLQLLDEVILDYFKQFDEHIKSGNETKEIMNPSHMNNVLTKLEKAELNLINNEEEVNGWDIDDIPF